VPEVDLVGYDRLRRRCDGQMEREPGRLQRRYALCPDEFMYGIEVEESDSAVMVSASVCSPPEGVGEIAGAERFATDAKLARAAGLAPVPASSGKTNRHRLDRGGNRQVNAALHRVIVTRARCHPLTRDYIARRRSEGKSTREAIRCLKRYLARRVWQLLRAAGPPDQAINTSIS
jgi:hypothetical protein